MFCSFSVFQFFSIGFSTEGNSLETTMSDSPTTGKRSRTEAEAAGEGEANSSSNKKAAPPAPERNAAGEAVFNIGKPYYNLFIVYS
jgi:hypothetical protein